MRWCQPDSQSRGDLHRKALTARTWYRCHILQLGSRFSVASAPYLDRFVSSEPTALLESAPMTGVDPRVQLLALALLLATAAPETSPNAPALRRLRELSSEDLVQLVNAGYPRAEVTLDFRSIEHGLRMIRDRRDHDARLDHFIQHGATTALMHQLFRVPVAAIKARRVQLLGKHRQRRPRMPRPHVRDAIHAAWWQIRGGGAAPPDRRAVRRAARTLCPPELRDPVRGNQRIRGRTERASARLILPA